MIIPSKTTRIVIERAQNGWTLSSDAGATVLVEDDIDKPNDDQTCRAQSLARLLTLVLVESTDGFEFVVQRKKAPPFAP